MSYASLLEHAALPLEGEELFLNNYFSSSSTLPSISLVQHEKAAAFF